MPVPDLPVTVVEHVEQILKPSSNLGTYLSFIKPKPKPKTERAYKDLPCSEEDAMIIHHIIRTISEKGKWWLMKHRSEMNALGDSINHVHPLKFLETIFSDDLLKERMKDVFDDYFKKNGFMEGVNRGLTARSNVGELDAYLDDFAKSVRKKKEEIKPYFDNQDWEGLVRHLIYN